MKSLKAEQTDREVYFSNSYQWFAVKPREHIKGDDSSFCPTLKSFQNFDWLLDDEIHL